MPVDDVVGRLKPGVSSEQAAAGLSVWASGRPHPKAAGDRPVFIDAGTTAGYRLSRLARSSRAVRADLLRVRIDPDDRLRECRQPAARACGLAPAGDRDQVVARRVAPANHPSTPDGEPHPCAHVCGLRFRRFPHMPRRCIVRGDHHDARGNCGAGELRRPVCGLAGAGVPDCRRYRLDRVLRARAGVAGHPCRTGPRGSWRSHEGRASRPRATCPDRRPGRRIGPPPDLRRRVPAKCLCRRPGGSRRPDERYDHGSDRKRASARGDRP